MRSSSVRSNRSRAPLLAAALLLVTAGAGAQEPDPRIGLAPGGADAASAAWNLVLVATTPRPPGFSDPANPGNILFANSDLAFRGTDVFMGSFHGFNIYDVSDPTTLRLRTSFVCPGGQGDVTVHGDLLFMSVEMPNGRIDCAQGTFGPAASRDRFRGVRIFDISNLDAPAQVAAIQTCRGSHTHTLVTDPADAANVWIYVSGTSAVRSAEELAGCSGLPPERDANTSYFRIEVIQVPLASPQEARIVNEPRIFADAATGRIGGLWSGGDHGPGTQTTSRTDQCHDITSYPEIGLAAGACSGNGILLDISDPANPVRIDEVADPNFAYWHSATFDNDGTKVIFTDEWGGGLAARCRASDRPEWGANALFRLTDRVLDLVGYYKLPVPQTEQENCVAHNGSLIPVPGRDVMVQAWYQGGISVFDFTDPANPFEIAFFDRGPLSADALLLGGYWSAYWYNGRIWGSEITRGLDVLDLVPSEHLTQNEIDAAKLVRFDALNPQHQVRNTWPADVVVARAYLDQLERGDHVPAASLTTLRSRLDAADRLDGAAQASAFGELADEVERIGTGLGGGDDHAADVRRLQGLAHTLRDLAAR